MDTNEHEPNRERPVLLDTFFAGDETTCPLCGRAAVDVPQALRIIGPVAVVAECERDALSVAFRDVHPTCLAERPALAAMAYQTGPPPAELPLGPDGIFID